MGNARVTYEEIEFAATDATTPKARVTEIEIEFAATDATTPKARVTEIEMEWLAAEPSVPTPILTRPRQRSTDPNFRGRQLTAAVIGQQLSPAHEG